MRLIVQKTDEGLEIGGDLESIKEINRDNAQIMIEDGPDVYDMAVAILKRFPRFKEVIVNTNISCSL